MALAIKRVHNLPPRLSYVSTLPNITQKPKSYVILFSIPAVWVALERTSFGGSENSNSCMTRSQYVFKVTSLCLHTCMQLCFPLVSCFVDEALRNTIPSVNESLLQLVNVMFRFLYNVNAKFHCNRLKTVQDIQDYVNLFLWNTV